MTWNQYDEFEDEPGQELEKPTLGQTIADVS